MREEPISLSVAEQKRAMALNRVLAGEWTRGEAARVLGLSERHLRRLLAAYRQRGPQALAHGNRGRASARATPAETVARALELARGRYAGFNDQHLAEKLAEAEGLALARSTLRRILRAAGLPSPRRRRPPKHRARRERMPQEGMLLQADGSRHDWLAGRGPYLTLVGGVDDATGAVPWALFREQEDGQGYLAWLRQVALARGLPLALYVDRHGIFERSAREPLTLEEELAGGRLPTQVGRALDELGIRRIAALSPQAKGRVERLWGTFQDRLGSELRLAGAATLEQANAVLWAWLPDFNRRFAVPAAQPGSAYRPWPDGLDPERVFCFKYARVVAADNTVRLGAHRLQLLPDPQRASFARAEVELHERLDGSLAVYHQGRCLATRPAPPEAPTLRARKLPRPPTLAQLPDAARPRRPAAEHPWRRAPFKAPAQAPDGTRQP
jgi:transposase